MRRILVFGMTEVAGGVESFLMNYYRNIDRSLIQFDFLCNTKNSIAYEKEILSMGGKTYHITARSKNPIKYYFELDSFFKSIGKSYDTIWVNVNSLANIDYLKMAKKYGIRRRIIHSHNAQNMDNKLRGKLHQINKAQIDKFATDYWACSPVAAEWFYRDDLLEKAVIIKNAIDVETMRFDEAKRRRIREDYCWNNKFIIGNVGRLHFQKNQSFAIDVFYSLSKSTPDAILVLVGQGEDELKLKEKASALGISDKVFFVGEQLDIQAWLSAFDVFLFPSVFEGLGIALLEAQANGLPSLASKDVIPKEVKINPNVEFLRLEQSCEIWSDAIRRIRDISRCSYYDVQERFVENYYDIHSASKRIVKLLSEGIA